MRAQIFIVWSLLLLSMAMQAIYIPASLFAPDTDNPLLQPYSYHLINLNDENFLVHMILNDENHGSYRVYGFPSTLNRAGFYRLANGLTATITIAANDITLDMNGCTVSGGIVINSGLKNVTIRSGIVDATGTDGIQVNSGCTSIKIADVSIRNATCGINGTQLRDSVIRNCDMTRNATGLELTNSSNVLIQNCTAQHNSYTGFGLVTSTTCALLECKAISTGDGSVQLINETVFGIVSQSGTGNIFDRCIASSTQALTTTDFNSIVAGIALRGTEQFSRITNCEVANTMAGSAGLTIPRGIYLETRFEGLRTATSHNPAAGSGVDTITVAAWSPDGNYLAIGGIIAGDVDSDFIIYRFDRVKEVLIQVDAKINPGTVGRTLWSPSGRFIAVGANYDATPSADLSIFTFDRETEKANQIIALRPGGLADASVIVMGWSPDERYLIVGTDASTNAIFLYRFDAVAQTLTQVQQINGPANADVRGNISFSPDGKFVGVAFAATATNNVIVYYFDREQEKLFTYAIGGTLTVAYRDSAWSPDGKYLAVAKSAGSAAALINIHQFDRAAKTLTVVASIQVNPSTSDILRTIAWSPDGTYIIGGGASPVNRLFFYKFDRSANVGTLLASFDMAGGTPSYLQFSPDGRYIAAGLATATGDDLYIIDALKFPTNNVVKNNTVYGNSGNSDPGGVGISGSSISNLIIGNTAYNNPVNPPVVYSNYYFAANVFNQLFNTGPTLVQNIGVIEPVLTPDDIDLEMMQIDSRLTDIQTKVNRLLTLN